jgi:uncharacterized protein (TIGR02611 family)
MSASDPPRGSLRRRAHSFRARVHRLPGGQTAWRAAIALIGLVLVLVGVALLPLPGPGWLIIFAGIGVWASEFAWARRLLHRARAFVTQWVLWVKRLPRWQQCLLGASGTVVLVAVVLVGWLWFAPR